MIYYIYSWYGGFRGELPKKIFKHRFAIRENKGTKKKPEWVESHKELDAVEISDLNQFIQENGPVIVRPPEDVFQHWSIYVTDKTGRFGQR